MDFYVTDVNGYEKGMLEHCGVNIVIGEDNDFEITVQSKIFDSERHGKKCHFFCPDTEYGGLIRSIHPVTADKIVKLTGMTWRGLLNQKAMNPEKNSYIYLDGEANSLIGNYLQKLNLSEIFQVSKIDSGITLSNYKVPLQSMFLDTITAALSTQNARLDIKYKQGAANASGYVVLQAVPITDSSQSIELNEDGNVNFDILDYENGVNHLICLGSGEVEDRMQVDLYVWPDGSVRKEAYYTGIDVIEKYYENSNVETVEELEEEGRDEIEKLMNYKQLKISLDGNEDHELGDIVGGRERITNICMTAPVVRKIVDVSGNGRTKISYKLKGE